MDLTPSTFDLVGGWRRSFSDAPELLEIPRRPAIIAGEEIMPLLGRGTNPFYVLLVIAGIVFAVTACAYGVMTVKQLHAGQPAATGWLMETLTHRGEWILAGEIGVLAVFTVAAMATDHWFESRSKAESKPTSKPEA